MAEDKNVKKELENEKLENEELSDDELNGAAGGKREVDKGATKV